MTEDTLLATKGRALPSDRASRASPQAPSGLSHPATIPSAGDWAVVCTRSYSSYMSHEVAVIDSVKPKTVWAKVGFGRRLRRIERENVIPAQDEQDARRICARLDSAKAEAQRREREARAYYKQQLGKAYASAIEARSGETREAGLDPKDESAVPSGRRPTSVSIKDPL